MSASQVVERFYRQEYGRLVAGLSRRVGTDHLEAVEDAAQWAMMAALETWPGSELPENSSAWLFRVARNRLFGELRKHGRRRELLEGADDRHPQQQPEAFSAGEVEDDLLRMLFVCCDESIPVESQLVLALKVLLGFDVGEIAHLLFTSEANVYKRLSRARNSLRSGSPRLPELTGTHVGARMPSVHRIVYLLFTEGHLSSHPEMTIRKELCREAIRLARILAAHPVGGIPETFALLALMHLHLARMPARLDVSGGLLRLEEQDRDLWDREMIDAGLQWLARSASGDVYSRYHAEAAIAAEHGIAPSFEETRWDRVSEAYALLDRVAPSALHTLNRAVAVAEGEGAEAGLAILDGFEPPSWLSGSYMWAAVLSDLNRRSGNARMAKRYRDVAIKSAPTEAVKALLDRRLRPLTDCTADTRDR